jgi:hypothetical protein
VHYGLPSSFHRPVFVNPPTHILLLH